MFIHNNCGLSQSCLWNSTKMICNSGNVSYEDCAPIYFLDTLFRDGAPKYIVITTRSTCHICYIVCCIIFEDNDYVNRERSVFLIVDVELVNSSPATSLFYQEDTGIILCMRPSNERRRYNVMSCLIGWMNAHTKWPRWYKHCRAIIDNRRLRVSSLGQLTSAMLIVFHPKIFTFPVITEMAQVVEIFPCRRQRFFIPHSQCINATYLFRNIPVSTRE